VTVQKTDLGLLCNYLIAGIYMINILHFEYIIFSDLICDLLNVI
jgi:hypothetical protein